METPPVTGYTEEAPGVRSQDRLSVLISQYTVTLIVLVWLGLSVYNSFQFDKVGLLDIPDGTAGTLAVILGIPTGAKAWNKYRTKNS